MAYVEVIPFRPNAISSLIATPQTKTAFRVIYYLQEKRHEEGERMKVLLKRALLLSAILAILSCAGIPNPKSPDETLVIGSLLLDFPDGFFDYPPRTIASGVEISMVNTTENYAFVVRTGPNGYYTFISNGHDTYSLERYHYEETIVSQRVNMQGKLNVPVSVSPGKVRYVGALTITYARPSRSNKEAVKANLWNFETSATWKYRQDEMIDYIKSMDPESQWLSLEIDIKTGLQ